MKKQRIVFFAATSVATALFCIRCGAAPGEAGNNATNRSKEVLLREDGKDRHWLIRSNSVIFLGEDRAGGDFFLTNYPMKKQRFENGVLKKEEDFLKELRMR